MSKVITANFPTRCMTCCEVRPVGTTVNWEKDIGSWCVTCPEPRSLRFWIRRRDQAKAESQQSLPIAEPRHA